MWWVRIPSSPPASFPKINEFETSPNSPDNSGTCRRYQRLISGFPVSIPNQLSPFRQKSPRPIFSVKFGEEFPDNGRFTGNFANLTGNAGFWLLQIARHHWGFGRNSLNAGTGNLISGTGNFSEITGKLHQWIR